MKAGQNNNDEGRVRALQDKALTPENSHGISPHGLQDRHIELLVLCLDGSSMVPARNLLLLIGVAAGLDILLGVAHGDGEAREEGATAGAFRSSQGQYL